eukprot:919412-Pelagomonas_calceolata.AAC.2
MSSPAAMRLLKRVAHRRCAAGVASGTWATCLQRLPLPPQSCSAAPQPADDQSAAAAAAAAAAARQAHPPDLPRLPAQGKRSHNQHMRRSCKMKATFQVHAQQQHRCG